MRMASIIEPIATSSPKHFIGGRLSKWQKPKMVQMPIKMVDRTRRMPAEMAKIHLYQFKI